MRIDSKQKSRWMGWIGRLWIVAGLLLLGGLGACGPSFPGKITLVDEVTDVGASALVRNGNYLYLFEDQAKLQVFDITDPKAPKKLTQVDSFPGPYQGATLAFGGRWLVAITKAGDLGAFTLDDPKNPVPKWGRGKTIKIPAGAGPFTLFDQRNLIYMTPGNGKAIVQIELSALNGIELPGSSVIASAIKEIAGGGGGGIALVFQDAQKTTPVRLYVGNKDSGKVEIWIVQEIESGAAKAPTASVATTLGSPLAKLFSYKQYLFLVSAASEGKTDLEIFDLGRNWVNASDPKSFASSTVNSLFTFDADAQLMFNTNLQIYDFTKDLKTPTLWAQSNLREFEIRDMLLEKSYLFTAESLGLRVYQFAKNE